jgi:branched-chain amino acid transport system permease protein
MSAKPLIAVSIGLGVLFVLLAALPHFANRYAVSLGCAILSYVILSTAWAMFSGPTRYVSLATAAFFGIGAYGMAGLASTLPLPLVLLIAGAVGFVVALVVGLSTLRLSGVYFVIFTFGLSELIRQLVTWFQINITKTRVSYIFVKLGDNELYYYLVVLWAILLVTCVLVQRSRLGFALRVIGQDETVAKHAGINTTLAKLSMFALSSVFMSVTGAVMAPRWTYIDPNIAFNPLVSFQVVIMALLGGVGPLYVRRSARPPSCCYRNISPAGSLTISPSHLASASLSSSICCRTAFPGSSNGSACTCALAHRWWIDDSST